MSKQLEAFINKLAEAETATDTTNQFAYTNANHAIRRANLLRYLQTMQERRPKILMVMEAPGYRGSRLTGVPVTSRKVLLEGIPALEMFGERRGFQNVDDPGFERVYGEQSATILWNTLAEIGAVPLIWNAYPFHPHKPGQPLTNRKPRKTETKLGETFIRRLIEIYHPKTIIAIGNVASDTLSDMGINCARVRHPAQGGKNDFVAGLKQLLG